MASSTIDRLGSPYQNKSDGKSEDTVAKVRGKDFSRQEDVCLDLHGGFGRTRDQYWTEDLLVRNSSGQLRKQYQGSLQTRRRLIP